MLAAFGVLVMAGCIRLACCKCREVNGVYVCANIPQSFPKNLKSILVFGTSVGELNSTVFTSDNLTSVNHLTLSATETTDISFGALSKFQNLEILELTDNYLKKVTPGWLSHPEILKQIILSRNIIESINMADLANFSSLVHLNLSGNHVHTISLGSFSNLGNLEVLDLSGNSLNYLNPEICQPLNKAKIHLSGNPWDCSCGRPDFENFVIFLQALRNASRLENENAVTCRTPVFLQGAPVWSMTCPSPSPTTTGVPGTTSTPPTITGVSVTGRATPSTLSTHTPSTGPVLGLPGLISLIVLLCILMCIISVLSFLYHRKLKRKRVMPQATAARTLHIHQAHLAQKRDLNLETVACAVSQHKGRAKSAGPVMCRSEVFTKAQTILPEDGGKNDLHKASEENRSEEGGPHAAIIRVNGTEHTEEHDPGFPHGERNPDLGNNTAEDLPYLTIGVQPSPGSCDDHGNDKTGKTSHSEKMQKKIVRVKTWPPTAFQWARQKAKQEDVVDVTFFQNLQAELMLEKKAILDVNLQLDISPPGGTQTNVPESFSVQMPPGDSDRAGLAEESSGLGHDEAGPSSSDKECDDTVPDDDHHVIDVEPDLSPQSSLRFETHEGSDNNERLSIGLQGTLRFETQDHTDSDDRPDIGIRNQETDHDQSIGNMLSLETTKDMAEGNDDTQLEMDTKAKKTEEDPSVSSVAAKKSKVEMSQLKRGPRELDTTRRKGSRADKSTAAVPPAPLKPHSPGDETLLQDNEYVFINLLHEVVENRGRWTRERWRQSHLNRRKFLKKQ